MLKVHKKGIYNIIIKVMCARACERTRACAKNRRRGKLRNKAIRPMTYAHNARERRRADIGAPIIRACKILRRESEKRRRELPKGEKFKNNRVSRPHNGHKKARSCMECGFGALL